MHRHHHRNYSHRRAPHLGFGLAVVAAGALLLLRELHLLPDHVNVGDVWPVFVIGFGLSRLGRGRGFWGNAMAASIATLGGGMLLETLHVIDPGVIRLWPLIIIFAGLGIMTKAMRRRGACDVSQGSEGWGGHHRHDPQGSVDVDPADVLHRDVTLGGAQIKMDSQQFKGGHLSTIMGGIEVDLRRANLAEDETVLHVSSILGGIDLRVPEGWRIIDQVSPILGGVDDGTHAPVVGAGEPAAKRLILRGSVILGGVSIRN